VRIGARWRVRASTHHPRARSGAGSLLGRGRRLNKPRVCRAGLRRRWPARVHMHDPTGARTTTRPRLGGRRRSRRVRDHVSTDTGRLRFLPLMTLSAWRSGDRCARRSISRVPL
jgi:hypothetical protein